MFCESLTLFNLEEEVRGPKYHNIYNPHVRFPIFIHFLVIVVNMNNGKEKFKIALCSIIIILTFRSIHWPWRRRQMWHISHVLCYFVDFDDTYHTFRKNWGFFGHFPPITPRDDLEDAGGWKLNFNGPLTWRHLQDLNLFKSLCVFRWEDTQTLPEAGPPQQR